MCTQKVLIMVTLPIGLENHLLKKAHMLTEPSSHISIRAPFIWPKLIHHVLKLLPSACVFNITEALTRELLSILKPEERIIIFIMKRKDANNLRDAFKAARHHLDMPQDVMVPRDCGSK